MLDIEFLKEPPKNLKHFLLYEYNGGFFKSEITSIIKKMFNNKDISIIETEPSQVINTLRTKSLFGKCCAWVKIENIADLNLIIDKIHEQDWSNYCYLEIDKTTIDNYSELENYILYSKSAIVVRETEVHSKNYQKVVNFLVEYYLNKYNIKIDNIQSLESGICEYFDRTQCNIGALINIIERVILININGIKFDLDGFRKTLPDKIDNDFLEWHKVVANLLQDNSKSSINKIIKMISKDIDDGLEHRQIIGKLFRVIQEFSWVNHILNPMGQKPDQMGDYKWKNLLHYENIKVLKLLRFQVLLAELEIEVNCSGCLTCYKQFLDKVVI